MPDRSHTLIWPPIKPDFAARCHMRIGDLEVAVKVGESAVIGKADPHEAGEVTLVPKMPGLMSPSELRDTPDQRGLGPAGRVEPSAYPGPVESLTPHCGTQTSTCVRAGLEE